MRQNGGSAGERVAEKCRWHNNRARSNDQGGRALLKEAKQTARFGGFFIAWSSA
jgi:hypothetical protein